ncbi:MAG TPA: proton-conducting transporter membrane subunit [Bryobacteraceae bacterium]|nr:proton-conducting transporter membrane subunit [Bryobacteraceae bacterium]
MAELPLPVLTVCIVLPLAAAAAARRMNEDSRARRLATGALVVTMALLLDVLRRVLAAGGGALAEPWGTSEAWLIADGLNAVPMVLFTAIALVALIAAPKRDATRDFLVSLLTLTASTLAVYASANLLLLLAAWLVPLFPVVFRKPARMVRIVLGASGLCLAAAAVLITAAGEHALSLSFVNRSGAGGPWAFAFLILAAILRDRIFPFHRATVALFDGRPVLLAALLVNAQLGVFLIARVAMPLFPEIAATALPWLGGLALFTTIYTAVLGLAEGHPRRVLALLMASQSAGIFTGLATASHEGVAGAFMQWIVLAVSSTILIAVYRSVEVRVGHAFGEDVFLGLAATMPRLAVFFVISALTMVGLPGTLGFAGEDLLLHGVLAEYPWWGAALPAAIALNAYHGFRLFARLFLGKDTLTRDTAFDALPRERWALSACLAFLVWGGLVPREVVALQAPAAGALVRTVGSDAQPHP